MREYWLGRIHLLIVKFFQLFWNLEICYGIGLGKKQQKYTPKLWAVNLQINFWDINSCKLESVSAYAALLFIYNSVYFGIIHGDAKQPDIRDYASQYVLIACNRFFSYAFGYLHCLFLWVKYNILLHLNIMMFVCT